MRPEYRCRCNYLPRPRGVTAFLADLVLATFLTAFFGADFFAFAGRVVACLSAGSGADEGPEGFFFAAARRWADLSTFGLGLSTGGLGGRVFCAATGRQVCPPLKASKVSAAAGPALPDA